MKILHQAKAACPSVRWSGGTTTELLIWPPEASYSGRDFLFRLSSASVETEESVFTLLPGIVRWITPLSGGFTLTHRSHHSKTLHPYEIDHFCGGWETQCRGTGMDFNLMLRGSSGMLQCIFGETMLAAQGAAALCFYFPQGGSCRQADTFYRLNEHELLTFFLSQNETLQLQINATVVLYAHIDIPNAYHILLEEL
ncbi:MAG: HutD family protein [Clostridiaceae bacterium]|nr:HutD family protein [Clostridiaceae bacterium]